jgi:hypothetical protein
MPTLRNAAGSIFLTTRDQEVEIVLLTNLPPADADAGVVSELFQSCFVLAGRSNEEAMLKALVLTTSATA